MQQRDQQIERPSTIRLAYWESLMALRSGGVRIALFVFCLLLLAATVLGVIRTQARQHEARIAEQDNQLVMETFQKALEGTLNSAESAEENSTRQSRLTKQLQMTARSPYLVSHSTNLWNVSLFPSPLSALSVGASASWPDLYRINGMSISKTLQRSDQIRPSATVYGPLDVTFVVMAIAPLVVIGLTFNVSSRDRESALQNLLVSQTSSLGRLMAIRCFVRSSLVMTVVVVVVNGTLLIAFANQFDWNVVINLATWNVTTTVYLLLWGALSLFVNSFARTSSANAATLLLLWLLLVLLIPRFVSKIVQESVPTLPESELVEREQNTIDEATTNVEEQLKRFQSEHPEVELRSDDEQQMALAGYLLAHRASGLKAPGYIAAHHSARTMRATYLNRCDWISPAISFRNQSDRCSGNSEQSFIDFSIRTANTQAQVADVFLLPSVTNQECRAEFIAAFPSFQEATIPRQPSFLLAIQSLASMLAWLAILTFFGTRRFRERASNSEQQQPSQRVEAESA